MIGTLLLGAAGFMTYTGLLMPTIYTAEVGSIIPTMNASDSASIPLFTLARLRAITLLNGAI